MIESSLIYVYVPNEYSHMTQFSSETAHVKQEAHGPHSSPENSSINTHDYIITLINRKKTHYKL